MGAVRTRRLRKKPTEISGMANIHGLHVSMHCSMASEVMESFLSFLFLSIEHAFELPDFGTVAASDVTGSVVKA